MSIFTFYLDIFNSQEVREHQTGLEVLVIQHLLFALVLQALP